MIVEIVFMILGVVIGILSIILGIGGGIFIVPALIILSSMDTNQAVAISAVCIAPISFLGMVQLKKMPPLPLKALLFAGIGACIGGITGAYATSLLPQDWHKMIIVSTYLLLALSILYAPKKTPKGKHHDYEYGVLGGICGASAGLLGIGGGIILVPILERFFGHHTHDATHISLAIIMISLVPSALTHLVIGDAPFENTIPIILGAAIGTFAGAKLKGKIKAEHVRLIHILILIFSSLAILIG